MPPSPDETRFKCRPERRRDPPLLRGWDTAAEARGDLKQQACRLGRVRLHNPLGLPAGDLVVRTQNEPAGRVLGHGAAVSVTLAVR
jgi:hypothetical protein